ncbi:MAG: SH3 domain-containing protein [Leptolyngbya sp.]|nr:SH3 domain-containing protein [Leptolyngbya sp.]
MFFKQCQGVMLALVGVLLSVLGLKPAAAVALTEAESPQPLAQAACPHEWQTRQPYARVITERDPLRIRATPNGRVIGSVPPGWAVVVLGRDRSGQWTKITSHFGEYSNEPGFASAPDFRNGWVATRFLRNLGDFCDKPMASGLAPLVASTLEASTLEAPRADWLALGDDIAQVSQMPSGLNPATRPE